MFSCSFRVTHQPVTRTLTVTLRGVFLVAIGGHTGPSGMTGGVTWFHSAGGGESCG